MSDLSNNSLHVLVLPFKIIFLGLRERVRQRRYEDLASFLGKLEGNMEAKKILVKALTLFSDFLLY